MPRSSVASRSPGASEASEAPQAPDAEARCAALDATRSFLVQAPAGSGKTELLIQRYLALLETVEHPEEIVAITFTVKAAGEMRSRVLQALAEGRAKDRWQLAESPSRLRIQTIDALCAALTRQMPLLSRFGAPPAVVEDASEHYLKAARQTIALIDSDEDVAHAAAHVLAHLDNHTGRLEELLAAMLAKRDQWLRRTGRLPARAELEAVLAAERARRISRVRALYGGEVSQVSDWAALARGLLTKGGAWRKDLKGRYDGDEPLRRALLDILAMPPARYGDAQWEALSCIAALLPRAAAQLKLVFQARGEVDFSEISEAALRALGDDDAPTDLALALDYRIRHLLVDEFQDTSITQYELIARLTAGWEEGDGRTLFAVGDPMQSIYRFREAEVGEFLKTWKTGRLGSVRVERVRLSANFRSQAGIVEWVNRAFTRLLPPEEDIGTGAVPYTASVAAHPGLAGEAVSVHAFLDRDASGEAQCVLGLLRALRQSEPQASVAILVRDRGALRDIVPRMREAGLRFRAIEIDALGERPVVQDLWALTRALSHPADRIAWLAVLRAPWCGLTLADLSALVENPESDRPARLGPTIWETIACPARLERISADGRQRLARIREVLGAVLANRLRGRLRDAVEGAWLALGGPACAADETGLEDAAIFLDALEREEEAGALPDAARFERRMAKLWALPDVHAGEHDAQIMTIHKSKGLEFDHVIVPGLGRAPRAEDKRLFLWMERPAQDTSRAGGSAGASELLLAPIEQTGEEPDPIYRWLKEVDAERTGNEAARLLYVAATRARKRLHLLGDVEAASRQPAARSLLGTLWPAIDAEFARALGIVEIGVRVQFSKLDSDPNFPNQDLVRVPSAWRPAPPPPAAGWRTLPEARGTERIEFSWAGESARHVGSVVHRWLQRIAEDGLRGWDGARIVRLRSSVHAELSARGVTQAELSAAGGQVLGALRGAIEDERGRWLLGPRQGARSEHRIRVRSNGVSKTYVIDRLFTDEQGARWIVDFKTSRHEGAAVDAFLDREQARYRGQLEAYARALSGEHRLGLYFPLLSGWREWK